MNVIKKTSIWVWIALLCTILTVCFFNDAPTGYKPVLCGLLIIVWCSCIALRADEEPFSINKLFWIFNLVFFGFLPVIQVYLHEFPWFQLFPPSTCNKANIVILSSLGIYYLARKLSAKWKRPEQQAVQPIPASLLYNYKKAGFILFLGCCIGIVAVYGFGHLWLRRTMLEAEVAMNSTVQLVFDKLIRGCILYYMLLTGWMYRHEKISTIWFVVILLLCVITNFPFAVPRYLAATLYGGLLLTILPRFLRHKNRFAVVLVLLLITAFPLTGITRHKADGIAQRLHHPSVILKESFTYGEYDAYATLCRTVEYIAANGTTGGRQLAGVLLFFVPRSIWESKPVGSGMLIYKNHTALGVSFRNIASPFYAEGLINFGFIGCLLFVAALGLLAGIYDRYYHHKTSAAHLSYIYVFYPVAVMMSFFMMRGDLLSSFAFSAGFFIAGLGYHHLLKVLPLSQKKQG